MLKPGIELANLANRQAALDAARVFADCVDDSKLDEKEYYVLTVLRERLDRIVEQPEGVQ